MVEEYSQSIKWNKLKEICQENGVPLEDKEGERRDKQIEDTEEVVKRSLEEDEKESDPESDGEKDLMDRLNQLRD
eukprot:CAMPEP_0205826704 /NCGR_PEP_ID=MMETSP0206-20130828/29599_1 /ASSEMBLY_ACC=CAM_ASM_000279 /TAXON_ID=36767 /ORGANISM="Euplotes focardii, Strain TN1" /LENGTH=74 /DNA_ID=CAMNT_0053126879 /DNA_START=434 /DNA_END=658 /DNA_ORIENTATION=+